MIKPVITEISEELPVTVSEIKAQLIIDFSDDDALLESYIKVATGYMDGSDGILGRALMPQTVQQSLPDFESLILPYGEARSVVSVEYYDENGSVQTFTDYTLIKEGFSEYLFLPNTAPATADRPDAVTVTYEAGWPDVDSIPPAIKHAIKLLVSTWYEVRQTSGDPMSTIPFSVRDMLAPYRRVGL